MDSPIQCLPRSLRMPTTVALEADRSSRSPEERFLAYARTGDTAIIQALLSEYADQSYSQARRIIGLSDGAEDAVQDAFLRLVGTAKKYDGSVPFAAWLGRLVAAAAVDFRRGTQRRQKNLTDLSDQGAAAMEQHHTRTEAAEPPELDALRTALDTLPDHYRTPLTLYYFSGLNQNETAQALGAPPSTIANQLARGLEQLRDKLGRAGFAMTSAGLLAVFASLPTYAASAEFKAGVIASQRLAAAGHHASERVLTAKMASAATGSVFFKVAMIGGLAVAAAAIWSLTSKPTPVGLNHNAMTMESTPVQSPFGGSAWRIPGIVEAENYDLGGDNIAHHDVDGFNEGEAYRNDGVDIADALSGADDPAHPGPFIGWTRAEEWLEYTVDVAQAGNHTIEVRATSTNSHGVFHVEFDGLDKTGPLIMPAYRGTKPPDWITLTKAGVSLSAGPQVMRIVLDRKGDIASELEVANLNYIRVTAENSP
jgi:RNA polymerase sigma factor (sigma-70 family)